MSGDKHFYQTSPITPDGYDSYGVCCYVYAKPAPDRSALTHFYDQTSDTHFYSSESTIPEGFVYASEEGFVVTGHSFQHVPVPLFRFYNPNSDGYFYQTSSTCPDGYVPLGFDFEVVDPVTSLLQMMPLYRYFNPKSGKHFYTTITGKQPDGYSFEGIACYTFYDSTGGLARLYRFVQTHNGGHFYATSPVVPSGYAAESEEIYIKAHPSADHSTTPLYQYYNGGSDDHFYSTDPRTPNGYSGQTIVGYVLHQPPDDLMPLFHFYKPYQSDKPHHSLLHRLITSAVGDFAFGPAGAALGFLYPGAVDTAANGVLKYTVEGDKSLGLLGIIATGVALVLAGPIVAMAVFAGAVVAGNLLVRQRALRPEEIKALDSVFASTIDYSKVVLTDMSGFQHRPFTLPNLAGQTVVNLGKAFDDPLHYKTGNQTKAGQYLFHEMTHAWQVHHSSFVPGLVCKEIGEQFDKTILGKDVYKIGDADTTKKWSSLGKEQQAMVVESWYRDGCMVTSEWYPFIMIVTGGKRPSAAVG